MIFPFLYRKDKNGQIRQWSIKVIKNTIEINSGIKGGNFVKTIDVIKKGKNIGKANETTPEEQAVLEAQSKWDKKVLSGYKETVAAKTIRFGAMLARDYVKRNKKIDLPVIVQPKLDGYRALYNKKTNKIVSRGNKEYSVLYGTPLHKEMQKFNYNLDGELYTHNGIFENYGALRKKSKNSKIDDIKYHVYDILNDKPNKERMKILIEEFKRVKPKNILLVESFIANTKQEIERLHNLFLDGGYEGTMIRNPDGLYVNKRTSDLLKYKNFDDAEFVIIGFSAEKDIGDGLTPIKFTCKTKNGVKFNVQVKGTRQERHKMFKQGSKYIGKLLSVRFFGYSQNGTPRFPKSLRNGEASIMSNKNY